MTSQGWQQASPVRSMKRRNYLDAGDVPDYGPLTDSDDPNFVSAPPPVPSISGAPVDSDDPNFLAQSASLPGPASAPSPTVAPNPFDVYRQDIAAAGPAPIKENPKWWERLAAAGIGGAAGWSNAASRTRNPINIAAAQENILHPGYQDKVAQWQSRVMPAQAKLDLALQQMKAQEVQEQIAAQAEERMSHAQQRLNMANPHYGQREVDAAYAKENLPWLAPEVGKDGVPHYYIDKTAEANLTKPIPVSKLIPVSEYGGLYDPDQGKLVVTPGGRPDKPETEPQLRMRAASGDAAAIKAVKNLDDEMARRAREGRSNTTVNFSPTGTPNPATGQVDPFIKAIGDYEANPPAARSSSPQSIASYSKIIAAVKQYNPKWDMKNYGVVQGALKDFGSGKTSQTVDAINTVAGHLAVLDQAAAALKNGDIATLNRIGNSIGVQFGSNAGNAVARYNTIVHRIGPELGRVYGTATEGENALSQGDFDASRGPDLIHGAIASSAQLLNGKINSLQHRWETNVKKYNPNREFESVSPEAMDTFKRLGGAGSQSVTVQIPGHPPGQIPAANLAAFKAAHPDAKVQQ